MWSQDSRQREAGRSQTREQMMGEQRGRERGEGRGGRRGGAANGSRGQGNRGCYAAGFEMEEGDWSQGRQPLEAGRGQGSIIGGPKVSWRTGSASDVTLAFWNGPLTSGQQKRKTIIACSFILLCFEIICYSNNRKIAIIVHCPVFNFLLLKLPHWIIHIMCH